MTSDLNSATLIILVSMCILPLTALVASEAMADSKQPRRSDLTSKFNLVTSILYVTMLLWPLMAPLSRMLYGGGQLSSIDLRGFAAGKNVPTHSIVRQDTIRPAGPNSSVGDTQIVTREMLADYVNSMMAEQRRQRRSEK